MKTLIFDIETDGLLLDVSNFWVGYTYCIETKEYEQFLCPYSLCKTLREADLIVGHNIIGYDLPALYRLTKEQINTPVVDTLLLARLAYYDKDSSWSHSLDAYGERLGFPKGSHSDWSKYSEEMDTYCKQDVLVTTELYKPVLFEEALRLEEEAEALFNEGLVANQQSDDYVANGVLLASVLFFAGVSTRFKQTIAQIIMMVFASGLLLYGLYHLLTFPVN